MTQVLTELEVEALPEMSGAAASELEGEHEQFFGRLASLAARAAGSPALRRIGLAAARAALSGMPGVTSAIGGVPGSRGAQLGGVLGRDVSSWLGQFLPDSELGEMLPELEMETEAEVNPIKRWYPDTRESEMEMELESAGSHEAELMAMMEHLGHAAAEAESETESEQFLPLLLPLAAKMILPKIGMLGMKLLPKLGKGLLNIGRTLFQSPSTRPLIRTLPSIVRRTAIQIGRQAQGGMSVSPQAAHRILAQQAAQVLGSPQACVGAFRRSRLADRRFHGISTCTCGGAGR